MRLQVSHGSIWRQRVIGSLFSLPVDVLLWFTGLMPLRGLQLLVFPALLLAYLLALRAKDGRSLIAWPLYLCESVALGLFIQTTGGAASPFQVIAYPWMFGCALTLLIDDVNRAVVPLIALFTAFTLVFGGLGSEGFLLSIIVNTIGITGMTAGILTMKLERQVARTDALLPMVLNRNSGLEKLEHWTKHNEIYCLAFIDLSGFKGINDTYGHHIGDELLTQVAKRLRQTIRTGDIVLRYGGDEFVVATVGEPPLWRLESLFDKAINTSAGPLHIDAAIGHVTRESGETLDALLQRADKRMYEEKQRYYLKTVVA